MRPSKLYVARAGDGFFARVAGRGDYGLGPVLEERGLAAIGQGVHTVVVDFQSCSYLDSTFVGALVALACALREAHGQIILNCVSGWIRDRLHCMGLDNFFLVTDNPFAEALGAAPEPELKAVTAPSLSREEAARYIIRAHERLAEMCPAHKEHFLQVVEALKRELKRSDRSSGGRF